MREILFRGKRLDNGCWAYGDFTQDKDLNATYISGYGYYSNADGLQREPFAFEVYPETVGQFTGLTDKNGAKVFEGDIVKCSIGCPHEVVFKGQHGGTFIGGMPTFYLSNLYDGYAWSGNEEIIGNVHDNPDLLKG